MSHYNLVRRRPSLHNILFNAELTVFDNAVYRLSIPLSSLEIFALKLESCRKMH